MGAVISDYHINPGKAYSLRRLTMAQADVSEAVEESIQPELVTLNRSVSLKVECIYHKLSWYDSDQQWPPVTTSWACWASTW